MFVGALVGYGMGGPLAGTAVALVAALVEVTTISPDVPSGLIAMTGVRSGTTINPDREITLALQETGLEGLKADLFPADDPGWRIRRAGHPVLKSVRGRALDHAHRALRPHQSA